MSGSINVDSISDDALFESGTGSWNLNSLTSRELPFVNIINTMPLQNQEDSRNTSHNVSERLRLQIGRQIPTPRQTGTSREEPLTPPEVLMGAFDPSYTTVQSQHSREDIANGGARVKTTKNKENQNRNLNSSASRHSEQRTNGGRVRFSPEKINNFAPVLQEKKYDNDTEDENRSSFTHIKKVNETKQKKQNKNRNTVRNQTAPLTRLNNSDEQSSLNTGSIPLPANLNPNSNPQFVRKINFRNSETTPQNRERVFENDLETDFHSVNHLEPGQNSNSRNIEPSNGINIYNNLWPDERNPKKETGKLNITNVYNPDQNTGDNMLDNTLNLDSLTFEEDPSSASGLNFQQSPSNSRLDSQSVVVPYMHNTSAENHVQMNNIQVNTNLSPQNIVTTISFNISSSPTFTNSQAHDSSLNFSDSLPSNLSSNVLFGDGVSRDFLYAQKLQEQFNREDEAYRRQNQFDIIPNSVRNYSVPSNEHSNQVSAPAINDGEHLSTADFATANEFQTLHDSLTNRIPPVYDPDNINDSASHFYIPCGENLADSRSELASSDEVRPGTADIVISHETESHEPYPAPVTPDPIVLRYGEASNTVSPSESSTHGFVARGGGTQARHGDVDDSLEARRTQLELDEQIARMLQESEGGHPHSGIVDLEHRHSNHANLERNNSQRHHQPLRNRFGDTWRNRPLMVGPNLSGTGNNVGDTRVQIRNTWERPLQHRHREENEFAYLDNIRNVPVNEGYDIPPGQDYYYRYQTDPDFMLDDQGEDRLISINRDPHLLATLLMTRAPDMMIPNEVDLNDYEALWELAENLGEVRRVGMDQTDISLLPIHEYKTPSSAQSKDNKTDCLVCLNEFSEGERLKTLPCCHIYHVDCIDEWLRRNAVCPVCRQSAIQRQ